MKLFAQELAGFCMAYNKPFSEALARVYIAAIGSYDEKVCLQALNATAIELGRLPTPAEIVRKIDPNRFANVTDRQNSNIVAQRIIDGVRKLGANAKPEKLLEYLGEVGYEVIRNQWVYICNNMQCDDEKIWFAQFRDQADAIISRHRAGYGSSMPSLPKNNSVLQLIENLSDEKTLRT